MYRKLKKGEIIEAGDEVDTCRNALCDEPVWEAARNIGDKAPDPAYMSHRQYRREIDGIQNS